MEWERKEANMAFSQKTLFEKGKQYDNGTLHGGRPHRFSFTEL